MVQPEADEILAYTEHILDVIVDDIDLLPGSFVYCQNRCYNSAREDTNFGFIYAAT